MLIGSPGGAPGTTRPEILASWRRSRANDVPREKHDLGRAEIDAESALVRIGAPALTAMAAPLVGTATLLSLADVDGNLLWRWESEFSLASVASRLEFEPGSRLAETSAGTNGIGLAMSSKRPTAVIGAEHYKASWRDWACFAAPITHPIEGKICGFLNVACRALDVNHFLHVALRALVECVQTALYDTTAPRHRQLLDASRRYRAAAAGPVVAMDNEIMIIDDAAAELNLDRSAVWELVRAHGPAAKTIAIRGDLTARVLAVTPGRLDDGVVLVVERSNRSERLESRHGQPAHVLGDLQRIEASVIRNLLTECHGNKSEVAQRLGISRGTLYQRLRRYGIEV